MMDAAREVVLVVDDEGDVRRMVVASLNRHLPAVGVLGAGSASEALEMMEVAPASLVLTDFRMVERDGVALLAEVRERWPWVARMLLTGFPDDPRVVGSAEAGVVERVLAKPLPPAHIAREVRSVLEERRRERGRVAASSAR